SPNNRYTRQTHLGRNEWRGSQTLSGFLCLAHSESTRARWAAGGGDDGLRRWTGPTWHGDRVHLPALGPGPDGGASLRSRRPEPGPGARDGGPEGPVQPRGERAGPIQSGRITRGRAAGTGAYPGSP